MKFLEKISLGEEGLRKNGAATYVALGDSVTHGCEAIGFYHYDTVYWNRFRAKLNAIHPEYPINVVNAGISGDSAAGACRRFERDVLRNHPDLLTICFGLNDVNGSKETYLASLSELFTRGLETGAEVIFITPNMLNTYVADDTVEQYRNYAAKTAGFQLNGRMDDYVSSAAALAADMKIPVVDCYSRWKALYAAGVDTTMLLSNRINHPTKEMHILFADMLYDTLTKISRGT